MVNNKGVPFSSTGLGVVSGWTREVSLLDRHLCGLRPCQWKLEVTAWIHFLHCGAQLGTFCHVHQWELY